MGGLYFLIRMCQKTVVGKNGCQLLIQTLHKKLRSEAEIGKLVGKKKAGVGKKSGALCDLSPPVGAGSTHISLADKYGNLGAKD